uniref:Uncharacterized protein n=1 Tax=Tanacetum cinerariifolium TaxID=118510 RepID=A0A6L2NUJ3_TANCI|nr:hypothetical protein [Tanacetum cinerariifolium]
MTKSTSQDRNVVVVVGLVAATMVSGDGGLVGCGGGAKYCPKHICKYYPDYPSYTPPPTSKPSRLKESMVALADTMAKLELASKRLATVNVTTTPPNTQLTFIMPPPRNKQLVTTPPLNNHGSKIQPPKHDKPMAKSFTISTSSISKIENVVVPQTRVPLSPLTEEMLSIFCGLKIFPLCGKCHRPKFVFLEPELEPTWE